jgi:asparagine synthetase A
MKTIKLSALVYEMLASLAKAKRKTIEAFLEETIKNLYTGKK